MNDDFVFVPLSPRFNQNAHAAYVEWLNKALKEKDADDNAVYKNIALSGVFGSGKSSILKKVAEENKEKTVQISLAPLISKTDNNNDLADDIHIQHEIVKQLLYNAAPHNIPLSRFHRIGSEQRMMQRVLVSIIVSLILFLVITALGWMRTLKESFPNFSSANFPYMNVSILPVLLIIFFFIIIYLIVPIFQDRFQIKQVSVGDASISTGDKSENAFDADLDEIIYFFSQEKEKHIVIFEDLDRFDEPLIFDALRELNFVLNKAPEVTKYGSVQFIYAVKDAIFSSTSNEEYRISETDQRITADMAFSRTKFFDLIIPVVPFISYENASRVARDIFFDANIDEEVLEIASRFIPDNRLLQNIRNEFEVYRRFIHCETNNALGLDESHLFSFLVYKNYYLTDADKLLRGQSILDEIYSAQREIVRSNIKVIANEIAELEQNRKILCKSNVETRADELWKNLKYEVAAIVNISVSDVRDNELTLKAVLNDTEFKNSNNIDFWEKMISVKDDVRVRFNLVYTPSYYSSLDYVCSLSKLQIQFVLRLNLNTRLWLDQEDDELKNLIMEKRKQLEVLRGADINQVMQHNEYTASIEHDGEESNLCDFITNRVGTGSLLFSLLEHGWINRDYMLYSTIYSDTGMTAPAMNFILHHVDCNNPDFQFRLDEADSKSVVRSILRRNINMFGEARMLNVDILNYLGNHTDDNDVSSALEYMT